MKPHLLATSLLLVLCVMGGCGGQEDEDQLGEAEKLREEAQKGISRAESSLKDMEKSLERLREQISKKDEENARFASRIKELEAINERLSRELNQERQARPKTEEPMDKPQENTTSQADSETDN